MALGDGTTWDETTPTDGTSAVQIDDYNRDLRLGFRSRFAMEHEMPASQSSTAEGGKHKFLTLQAQDVKPTVSGTQIAALYADTVNGLSFEKSDGTVVPIVVGNTLYGAAVTITASSGAALALTGTQFPVSTGLLGLNFAVTYGSTSHGGSVPLISGFATTQCSTIVSIRTLKQPGENAAGGDEYTNVCTVNHSNRVVTCSVSGGGYGYTGTVNWIVVGAK